MSTEDKTIVTSLDKPLFLKQFEKLGEFEKLVDKYTTKEYRTRSTKAKKLAEIEKGMNEIKSKLKIDEENQKFYNRIINKLDKYENSDRYKEVFKGKQKPKHQLKKIEIEGIVKERVEAIEQIGRKEVEEEVEERKEGEEDAAPVDAEEITTEEEEREEERLIKKKEAEVVVDDYIRTGMERVIEDEERRKKDEAKGEGEGIGGEAKEGEGEADAEPEAEAKAEVRGEEDSSGVGPEMAEFHNQIRRDERERVIKEFGIKIDSNGEDKIDIPKERLGVEGKSVKILNDDIKYFLKRFPDLLKLETNVYNKSDKKDRKLLVDIHRRIQAKLSPKAEETSKRIGIILDADSYIDTKINEILARKNLAGLTPANLVDITKEPKSQGKEVGSYTLTKVGGRDVVQHAPVYRAIPSTSDESLKEPSYKNARIDQSTIYKNSGKTKVDIAKMELNNNPFIRQTRPQRFNIIL